MRASVVTDGAPQPAGPYAQAVRIGGLIACSGQAGLTPDGRLVEGVGGQTRQALANIVACLEAAGASMDDVIHVRVYLTDPEQFEQMNEVYAQFFTEPYPARTTVYVGLPRGMVVEVDVLAAQPHTAMK